MHRDITIFHLCKRYFRTGPRMFKTPEQDGMKYNQPLSASIVPRCGGIVSMMRLPVQETSEGLDACFVGVPLDAGVTYRTGTRMGPRQIRMESVLLKRFNNTTRASPFDSLMVADVGDMIINVCDLLQAIKQIKSQTGELIKNGCRPLIMGGDHTITYPVLQAMKEKYGKVGLVHVDAHTDMHGPFCGAKVHHGSPVLLAIEEDLIDCSRVVQIGLRGTGFGDDWKLPKDTGFKVIPATECWHKSLAPMMEEINALLGDGPVYVSFDIDAIDPSYCPGTGAPEIGGLTTIQALEIVRGLRGLNIVGAEVVEVSPGFDREGRTALTAANLLFEFLCLVPGVKYIA